MSSSPGTKVQTAESVRTRASSRPMPTAVTKKPATTSHRCGRRPASRSAPAEATRMPIVAGVSRSPVEIALKPRTSCRNTEIVKNDPCSTSHWIVCVPRPRFAVLFLKSRVCSSGSRPARSAARRCRKNQARMATPISDEDPDGGDAALRDHDGAADREVLTRCEPPVRPGEQDAEHEEEEAGRGEDRADDVEARGGPVPRRVGEPARQPDDRRDHDAPAGRTRRASRRPS